MSKTIYPLATSTWDENEIDVMNKTIASGMLTMGEKVFEYEKNFAEYFNSKYAIMVNSGSSANLLAVASLFYRKNGLKLQSGDEVIVPSVSWSTTYMPLQQYGLKVKFVDIDIETLNFDLKALADAITDNTKMIFAVNLLGNSNNFSKIEEFIKGKNIILLEDNCESMGAKYNDKFTGTYGLMGTFSSYFSHHISTIEGGMITTNDEELYHILLSLRSHGWTRHLPQKNHITGIKNNNSFEESFKFVLPGYNVRPMELSGAIGIEQLKKLDKINKGRRENAKYFKSIFSNDDRFIIQKEIGESSWFGFSIIIKPESGLNRIDLLSKLSEYGIESRPIVSGDFTENEVIKYFNYEICGDLNNTKILNKYGFFIGNHHYNLNKELDLLKDVLASI